MSTMKQDTCTEPKSVPPLVSERLDSLGSDGKPVRLGIMGGTFDPIHFGHLLLAEQVREGCKLDALVFIPAGVPVFKQDKFVTPASQRLQMCRLAVQGNPAFDVSSIEIDRGGNTYTVDTLRQLRAHYPSWVEFFFIVGTDTLLSIAKWRESAEIARLAHLVAVSRPGFTLSPEMRLQIAQAGDFDLHLLEAPALPISSSELRKRVAEGKSIRYLTPLSVCRFIESEGLYTSADTREDADL